jgi:hypothetical protein
MHVLLRNYEEHAHSNKTHHYQATFLLSQQPLPLLPFRSAGKGHHTIAAITDLVLLPNLKNLPYASEHTSK